jgi:hypothetical protein
MQIPVLVEPVANNNFRARSGEPMPICADGSTPEDAVRNLRVEFDRQLAGKQLIGVEMSPENPWLAMAGIFDPNDPVIQEWKNEMASYRQELEADPDRP